jgi:YHS domain-containing protein
MEDVFHIFISYLVTIMHWRVTMLFSQFVDTRSKRLRAFVCAILICLVATLSGCNQQSSSTPAATQPQPSQSSFSAEDRQLIEKQKTCPVSGQALGSMDGPYRTEVEGKVVFLCCKSCTTALNKDPAKYLAKLK